MGILIVFVIVCACYAVTKVVLQAEHARPPTPSRLQRVWADPSAARTRSSNLPVATWGPLDDLQLTRLLTDSARRASSE